MAEQRIKGTVNRQTLLRATKHRNCGDRPGPEETWRIEKRKATIHFV